jgi:hypothetical protein
MTEATKTQQIQAETKQGISEESAGDLADFLSAVLRHPDTPQELCNAIGEEVCAMSNDLTTPEYTNSKEYIKNVLLASLGKAENEQLEETDGDQVDEQTEENPLVEPIVNELYEIAENAPHPVKRFILDYIFDKTGIAVDCEPEYTIEVSELAEAISFVLKHPDTPEILRRAVGDITCSTFQSTIDYDTPEMIERGLQAYLEPGDEAEDNERVSAAEKVSEHTPAQGELVSTATHRDRTIFVFADESGQFHSIVAKTSELSQLCEHLNERQAEESEQTGESDE